MSAADVEPAAGPARVRFSVIVPAHNEAATLPATLAALAAQQMPEAYEVIVVDNASTDATAAIARAAGVRVVAEPGLGVCRARQSGVEAARGDFVVSTDADTIQPPDWLARIGARFDRAAASGAPLVAVAGPCRYAAAPWWARVFPPLWFAGLGALAALTGRVWYVTGTNVAFRRAGFPGYDVRLHQGGDEVDLLRRLRRAGRVGWDPHNVVDTSSRRMNLGLLHTLFISYGWYYVIQRLRTRLRPGAVPVPAPAIRDDARR